MKITDRNKQGLAEKQEIKTFLKRIKEYASASLEKSPHPLFIMGCRAFIKSYYG